MQYIEKHESLDELLERIDFLKQEENYYEEDFHILGLTDLEPDWTDYMGSTYHPHADHASFKDFFTKNIKAKDFLFGSGLHEDLVHSHLRTLEQKHFLLAFNDDSLRRDNEHSTAEVLVEHEKRDNI